MSSVSDAATQLREQGYAVIPVFEGDALVRVRNSFISFIRSGMSEYLLDETTGEVPTHAEGGAAPMLVKGGFGALGNPSSFHGPIIREIRSQAQAAAIPLFKAYASLLDEDICLEQLVDRARVLRVDAKITPEQWHRDETPGKKINKAAGHPIVLDSDLIFGGWISLDGPQRFSAIRGSHFASNGHAGSTGFTPIDPVAYTEAKNQALEAGEEWYINVPAGHMLIFQQELVHEVTQGPTLVEESYRQFIGWRLTTSEHSLLGAGEEDFFVRQGVPLLKSNQHPAMYPSRAWCQCPKSRENLAAWCAETFQPCLLEKRIVSSGQFANTSFQVIPEHMYSLYDVALKRAAQDYYQEKQAFLDEEGFESFDDAEEQVCFEYAIDIMDKPPKQWREMHSCYDDEPGDTVLGFLTPDMYQRYMFEAYTQEERDILTPRPLALL
jgi:hypothetical protein